MPAENDHTTIQCYLITLFVLVLGALIADGVDHLENVDWNLPLFASPSYAADGNGLAPQTQVPDACSPAAANQAKDIPPQPPAVQIYD
jgi:hypothetical protein